MVTIFTICTIFTRFGQNVGNPHKIRLRGHFCGRFKLPIYRTLITNLSNLDYQKFELQLPKVRTLTVGRAGFRVVDTPVCTWIRPKSEDYQFVEGTQAGCL